MVRKQMVPKDLQSTRTLCDLKRRADEGRWEVSNLKALRSERGPSRWVLWGEATSISVRKTEEVERWVLVVREGPERLAGSRLIVSFREEEEVVEEATMNEREVLLEEETPLDVDETKKKLVVQTSTRKSCGRWILSEPRRGRGGFPRLLREEEEEGRELGLGLVEEVEEVMDPVFEAP